MRTAHIFPIVLGTLSSLLLTGCQTASHSMVTTQRTRVTIPTYAWGPHDINPHFQPTSGQMSVYPYPMQDNLGREKVDKAYEALVLENEYLRVTVLPELGGHVHSVYDKLAGREMFYVNKVVKPGLIGMAGAWISGGIEFNTGPLGHTVTAVYPVSCRFVEHADGSKSIAVGHVERIYRTQWMAQVRLRPGRRFLEERIRLYNPNSTPAWYYFWNCTAVPNTDGTEFIYPTKLMTDHGYSAFYPWPVHKGKDQRWSKNYDEPTGLFAYECDQDFFGSYDHDIDYGLVSYSDHRQVKGKKAWTWGRGDDGKVAMATLTDDGSWYNEIQTGPLQTQVDVAPLGPHQTIEWKEWWYPVEGLDGYEFATKDLAINVLPRVPFGGEAKEPVRQIRIGATGTFRDAECVVRKDGEDILRRWVSLRPGEPVTVDLPAGVVAPISIQVMKGSQTLASFVHPLPLPDRKPPEKATKAEGPPAIWREGIQAESQGNLNAAREKYEAAFKKQADFTPAMKSLAIMDLRSGLWEQAAKRLDAAIKINPEDGMARYLRAEAAIGMDDDVRALDESGEAARLAETTAIGLNMAAQVYIRQGRWPEAEDSLRRALRHDGEDLSSWNLLAVVLDKGAQRALARQACEHVLRRDPLDPHAIARLALAGGPERQTVPAMDDQARLEAAAFLERYRSYSDASVMLDLGELNAPSLSDGQQTVAQRCWMAAYHEGYNVWMSLPKDEGRPLIRQDIGSSLDYEWPHRVEEIAVLRLATEVSPKDERAWYLLGNVLFSKQRYGEARKAWDRAAELGLQYSVLYRNIGLAKDKLDNDVPGAIAFYEKAHSLNSHDQVVMRDLGRLYTKQNQWAKAVALLEKSLNEPIHRSDVTEDLVRAYEHLDQLDKAAALLDSRTFDQWENQQSLHDIYEAVHHRLGEKAMGRKDYAMAIREFQKAMEYPSNLGVGKPRTKSHSQCLYQLGQAYTAAGRAAEARQAWQRAADEGEKGGEFAKKAAAALASQPAP